MTWRKGVDPNGHVDREENLTCAAKEPHEALDPEGRREAEKDLGGTLHVETCQDYRLGREIVKSWQSDCTT